MAPKSPAVPEPGDSGTPDAPILSRWLGTSLVLSVVSIVLPHPMLPIAAGVLAFIGYTEVRRSGGRIRSRGLAAVAMTSALVLAVLTGWITWDRAPLAAAMTQVRAHVAAVDHELRDGTAETLTALFDDPVDATELDALRTRGSRLGPLIELGPPRETGSDWNRTATFLEGDTVTLELGLEFLTARFRHGHGAVGVTITITREGRVVRSRLRSVTVKPTD